LKEASEGSYQRSGSRKFHTVETSVEKTHKKATASSENRKADDDWRPVDSLTVV